MKVRDVMTHKVDRIALDASIEEAARRMASLDTDVLAVHNHGTLCGAVSCRDIVMNVTALGRRPNRTRVEQAMSPGLAYCFDDQDVTVPATMMRQNVSHVLVLDERHHLVGAVSMHDLAARCGDGMLAVQLVSSSTRDSQSKSEMVAMHS